MKIILDTHTFLWYVAGDAQLSNQAKSYIDNRDNMRYVSVATLWEIAIKYSIGKLTLKEPYEILIPRLLQVNQFDRLHLSIEHLSHVAHLSFPDPKHRDPFLNIEILLIGLLLLKVKLKRFQFSQLIKNSMLMRLIGCGKSFI